MPLLVRVVSPLVGVSTVVAARSRHESREPGVGRSGRHGSTSSSSSLPVAAAVIRHRTRTPVLVAVVATVARRRGCSLLAQRAKLGAVQPFVEARRVVAVAASQLFARVSHFQIREANGAGLVLKTRMRRRKDKDKNEQTACETTTILKD